MTTYCILNGSGQVVTTFANSQQPTTQTGYTEIPVDGGQVGQTWNGTAFVTSLEQQQAALLAQLEPQRLIVQSAGLSYIFPDGTTGTIQTRDPKQYPDLININGYATTADFAQVQGAPTMPIGFIDANNVTHPMTPAQAIAMCVAVSTFIGSLYTAKGAIRAQINALTAASVGAFDITQGW